ncbi:aminotransferase class III-fold pyridoxal phosphate-dependent enzyme, partial [Streptomyces anulatus]|uniref:aminotransferase class III-fold pyridoxal phosphate-dependent enzyme n=1 Tax=Streptomyces anulatus TaxID=1892 RepID=UPI003657C478
DVGLWGFGRTGRLGAHEYETGDATPDILVTAKGLASGFPLSAIAARADLMSLARPGSHGGTYGGNAVACSAALATLDVIRDEKLVANAAEQGMRLARGLHTVAARTPAVADVRGRGLMLGSEFRRPDGSPDPDTAGRAQQAAAELGLLLLTCGVWGNTVRMIPALTVTGDQIDEALALWSKAVAASVREQD